MTRQERLNRVIAAVNPAAAEQQDKDGSWPGGAAPYVFDLQNGAQRLRVTSTDGDVIAGVGATKDDALTMLEDKLRIAAE